MSWHGIDSISFTYDLDIVKIDEELLVPKGRSRDTECHIVTYPVTRSLNFIIYKVDGEGEEERGSGSSDLLINLKGEKRNSVS